MFLLAMHTFFLVLPLWVPGLNNGYCNPCLIRESQLENKAKTKKVPVQKITFILTRQHFTFVLICFMRLLLSIYLRFTNAYSFYKTWSCCQIPQSVSEDDCFIYQFKKLLEAINTCVFLLVMYTAFSCHPLWFPGLKQDCCNPFLMYQSQLVNREMATFVYRKRTVNYNKLIRV